MSGLSLDMIVDSDLKAIGIFHVSVNRMIIENIEFSFTFSGLKNNNLAWLPIDSYVKIGDLIIFTEEAVL